MDNLSYVYRIEKLINMKFRMLKVSTLFLLLQIILVSCNKSGIQSISILETTDIHGVILPYDYTEKISLNASLANAASYIKKLRKNNDMFVDF